MGPFDQAGRSAADIEAGYLLARVQERAQLALRYRRWFDPRTVPLPGGPERTADLVAILDDPHHPESPWLFVHELQTRHDEKKLEVLLVEAAIFACYAKDEDRQGGAFRTLPVFLYLSGQCPRPALDQRSPSGHGLLCAPVLWELEKDSALTELGKVAIDAAPWDALFWTILMDGAAHEEALTLWRRLLDDKVPAARRTDVAFIALQFAELVGCLPALERVLEDVKIMESTVYNRTLALGASRERILIKREDLLTLLDGRFPKEVPEEYLAIIQQQESFALLDAWFKVAVHAKTAADFLTEMRK